MVGATVFFCLALYSQISVKGGEHLAEWVEAAGGGRAPLGPVRLEYSAMRLRPLAFLASRMKKYLLCHVCWRALQRAQHLHTVPTGQVQLALLPASCVHQSLSEHLPCHFHGRVSAQLEIE